jgi:sirohydrochlorin ferrochelatase
VESKNDTVCILVDNGSLRSDAELFTRKLSRRLEIDTGIPVIAASLAHSDRIPIESLNGIPVPIFEALLEQQCRQNNLKYLWVIPFLLVTGGVIYEKIQSFLHVFSQMYPHIAFDMAEGLVSVSDPVESGVIGMIADQIQEVLKQNQLTRPRVVLVDHGSPNPAGARTRNGVAEGLASILGDRVEGVIPASMERRSGADYDFNEPLLERALTESVQQGHPEIVLARLFLQPGKHSGRAGDIEQICRSVSGRFPQLRIFNLPRVFSQKRLVQLLKRRLRQVSKE